MIPKGEIARAAGPAADAGRNGAAPEAVFQYAGGKKMLSAESGEAASPDAVLDALRRLVAINP